MPSIFSRRLKKKKIVIIRNPKPFPKMDCFSICIWKVLHFGSKQKLYFVSPQEVRFQPEALLEHLTRGGRGGWRSNLLNSNYEVTERQLFNRQRGSNFPNVFVCVWRRDATPVATSLNIRENILPQKKLNSTITIKIIIPL